MMKIKGGSGHPYLTKRRMRSLGDILSFMRIAEVADAWVAIKKLRNNGPNPNLVRIAMMKAHSILSKAFTISNLRSRKAS